MSEPLKTGFSTQIGFSSDPTLILWERDVTPPGLDGGGKIDITSMRNTRYKTFAPMTLLEVTDGTFTCMYDPDQYDDIAAMLQVEQTVTVTHSNGDTWSFPGFLDKFIPNSNSATSEDVPTAQATFVATNRNVSTDAEEGITSTPA